MTETKTPKSAKKTDKPEVPEEKGFVTREEFEQLKQKQEENTNAILGAIQGLQAQPVQPTWKTVENADAGLASAKTSNYTLSPAYQVIFEEYFDREDGFEARLEGVNFSIIVPLSLSNAESAFKKFYKNDIRLKVLDPRDMENGMRKWCQLVAKNLKYDRTKQLKK